MNKKYSFIEDDFELEKFQEEFGKSIEKKHYEKNKFKYWIFYFLLMLVSIVIAFFLYGALQYCINILVG